MKKNRIGKRILFLLATVCLLIGTAACSNSGKETDSTSASAGSDITNASTSTQPDSTAKTEQTTDESTSEPVTSTAAEESSTEETTAGWDLQPVDDHEMYVAAPSTLNIRKSPSADSDVLGVLSRGDTVTVNGIAGDWMRIRFDGTEAYVKTEYLSEEMPETAPPMTTTTAATSNPPVTGSGRIVCIDAGHQQAGISEKEPNGPGSSEMKAKLTTGTSGKTTGKAEYQLNLEVSLKLRDELVARGYQVIMIRENNDCPKSNAERAQIANASGAQIFIRVHANGSDDTSVNGAVAFTPSAANPYVGGMAGECQRLSQLIVDHFCAATGAKNLGIQHTDNMTGINWCTIPVTIIEMGFMSNPTEDVNMSDAGYQAKMVQGMANGIDAYFGN